ncbi:hypothetical protein [Spirosoma jeollabukense]
MSISMAIRSLLISLAVTGFLGYAFTVGLTDPNSFMKKLPDWLAISLFFGCGLLYLLATWWAIKGFGEHRISAIASLGLCVVGLGIYATVLTMELGRGKATRGQYDHDFTTLDPAEKAVLLQLTQEAGMGLQDAVFTEHWTIANDTNPLKGFEICVQKGHITALNLSHRPTPNLALLSKLPELGDLYLRNCGLSDMSGLQSTKLDRLDVADNQITDLKTLRGCPNVRWLFVQNNQLTSKEDLSQFKNIVSSDFRGNPIPNP